MRKFLLIATFALSASTCGVARAEDKPGVRAEYFDRLFSVTEWPVISEQEKPDVARIDPQIGFEFTDGGIAGTNIVDFGYVRWTGKIKIDQPGKYTFFTSSDDGSRVFIDGKTVLENGTVQGDTEKAGQIELTTGMHDIKVDYIENDGGAVCKFMWQREGGEKQTVPANVLFHAE